MYECIQIAENTYYIDCPAKMGIYKMPDQSVYVIDSGNDKEAGKKVKKVLDANGWHLNAIINTHSNADHIGGNKVLQERTGCKAYACGSEIAFSRNTLLEPSFLYGGYPFKALRNKFLMAAESDVYDISQLDLPEGMEIFPLKGHFFDMIGVKTPDDVYFMADCVSGENILEKYHIPFIYDVEEYIKTLEYVKTLSGKLFVPAHSLVTDNMNHIADINMKNLENVFETVIHICKAPLCFEQVLKKVFDEYSLSMDYNQYVLVGSTIRSILSYLLDTGKIKAEIIDNSLLWKKI